MTFFNFFKTESKDKQKTEFVGRHQYAIDVRRLLGEETWQSEMEQAIGIDISEHAEILSAVEKIESGINLGDLKHIFGAADMHKEIREIIDRGYTNCVLLNDLLLEERCFKILGATSIILQSWADKDGKDLKHDEIEHLLRAIGILSNLDLGGLLRSDKQQGWFVNTTDAQKAWFITCLLNEPRRLTVIFMLSSNDDLEPYGSEVKKLAEKLLMEKKLNNEQFDQINAGFENGLAISREHHKEKS